MKKILAIISLIQRIGTKKLILQAISSIVVIMGLVMTTAILTSASIMSGLIMVHSALLDHETPPLLAFIYIGCATLFIIASLMAVISWRLRCLRNIPHSPFSQSSLTSRATDALTAFTDGLMAD